MRSHAAIACSITWLPVGCDLTGDSQNTVYLGSVMESRNDTSKKRPTGARPLNRRFASSDSQQSSRPSDASNSGDDPVLLDTSKQTRSKASTLRLVEQGNEDGYLFSDIPASDGPWSQKATLVQSPDSEIDSYTKKASATHSAGDGSSSSLSSSRQRTRRPLPLEAHSVMSSFDTIEKNGRPVGGRPIAHREMSSGSESKGSPLQRSRRTLPPASQTYPEPAIASDPAFVASPAQEGETFPSQPDVTSPPPEKKRPPPAQRPRRPPAFPFDHRSPSPVVDERAITTPEAIEENSPSRSGVTSPIPERTRASPKQRGWKSLAPSSRPHVE